MFRVFPSESFEKELHELKERAGHGDHESIQLLKLIDKGIEKLKYDYRCGDHISRKKTPKEYRDEFGVENLWKLDLNQFWRMIYTIRGTEVEVISIVLEVLNHKEYDRKFGYRKH